MLPSANTKAQKNMLNADPSSHFTCLPMTFDSVYRGSKIKKAERAVHAAKVLVLFPWRKIYDQSFQRVPNFITLLFLVVKETKLET
jgi:hypothetical protein